ncbi:hypothetical protein KAH55_06140 [bacterium]|nr:hypothetical protein [bacterium]
MKSSRAYLTTAADKQKMKLPENKVQNGQNAADNNSQHIKDGRGGE